MKRLLPLLVLLLSSARAADPPQEAEDWGQRILRDYAHYAKVEFQFIEDAQAGPACPLPGQRPPPPLQARDGSDRRARFEADPAAFSASCQELGFRSWMLRADLIPQDQRVFSQGWLRVVRLPDGVQAEEQVRRYSERGAVASKAFQLVAPAGRYLVDLHLPCTASGLAVYEAADLLKALQKPPAFSVPVVAWSPCGRTAFELRTTEELLADAALPREYWGLDFPEARDRTRTGLLPGESADEQLPAGEAP